TLSLLRVYSTSINHCSVTATVPNPFFFSAYRHLRDLHSFPTRRSSDLRRTPGRRSRAACRPGRTRACPSPPRVQAARPPRGDPRSEEHTSELQSRGHLVCRLLLEKKKNSKHLTKSSNDKRLIVKCSVVC